VSLQQSEPASLELTLRRLVEDSVREVVREEVRAALVEHSKTVEVAAQRIVSTGETDVSAPWLTTKQAAELAGVQPSTIRSWIENQGLSAHRPGGARQYRISRQELDEFMLKQERRGSVPTPEESARKILARLGEKNLGDTH
jgi:excisionase family DNA binding protein